MIGNRLDFSFYNMPVVLKNFAPCLAGEVLLSNLPYVKLAAQQKLGGVKIQQAAQPLHQKLIGQVNLCFLQKCGTR